jgi:hypothetical protein
VLAPVQQPASLETPWERHYTYTDVYTFNHKSCSIVWPSIQRPPHIRPTGVTKSRRMRWASHLVHIEGTEDLHNKPKAEVHPEH